MSIFRGVNRLRQQQHSKADGKQDKPLGGESLGRRGGLVVPSTSPENQEESISENTNRKGNEEKMTRHGDTTVGLIGEFTPPSLSL